MLKYLKGLLPSDEKNRRKDDPKAGEFQESEFKEVAFNSRTKKTLVRDGENFLVVVGTNKSFVDTLRTLKYVKFDSMEAAIKYFKENGENGEAKTTTTDPN